ncbi:fungal specific transcription factor domain-containing protein [Colletotrichum higginsianum]|nr:fungal specific transcription factor domain-containing protein [Colletotrichum higginsianum]
MAPLDNSNNIIYGLDMLQSDDNLFSVSDVANHDTSANSAAHSDPAMPIHVLGQGSAPSFAEVSIHEGALFFQVYFETIHPRYPFLDVEECSRGYQDWRMGEIFLSSTDAWRSYLVKMIFAVGSLLRQAKLDGFTRQQHHNLMLQAQADQTILTDHSYKPLVRLQAMLLYAIHALHGESTPRLGHIIGVAMRFAVMKGFHRLVQDGTAETAMAIKAWWCIYM